jgi:protein-S-isoprenylcysteine O-methyltransferase Ste14
MLQQFPEQYAAYTARTGMLAPRLFFLTCVLRKHRD